MHLALARELVRFKIVWDMQPEDRGIKQLALHVKATSTSQTIPQAQPYISSTLETLNKLKPNVFLFRRCCEAITCNVTLRTGTSIHMEVFRSSFLEETFPVLSLR